MARDELIHSWELEVSSEGPQGLQPSSAFPGYKQGAGWEVEQLEIEPAPIWDA